MDGSEFLRSERSDIILQLFFSLQAGNAPLALQISQPSAVLELGAMVTKLAGGFSSISGAAIDPSGDPYFFEAKWNTIYPGDAASHHLTKVRDNPLEPVNLAFDKSGDLLIVSYAGKATDSSFKPSFMMKALRSCRLNRPCRSAE
jgi:hypothetical protein